MIIQNNSSSNQNNSRDKSAHGSSMQTMLVENSKTIYEHNKSNFETTDPLYTGVSEFKTEMKPTEEGEIGCKK